MGVKPSGVDVDKVLDAVVRGAQGCHLLRFSGFLDSYKVPDCNCSATNDRSVTAAKRAREGTNAMNMAEEVTKPSVIQQLSDCLVCDLSWRSTLTADILLRRASQFVFAHPLLLARRR